MSLSRHRSSPDLISRQRLVLVLILVLVTAHSAQLAATTANSAAADRTAAAMGTVLRVEARAPNRETAMLATEAALDAVEEVEGWLSTWRRNSELARLNRAPVGRWVDLSPALADVLDEVLAWRNLTAGAFDPLLAPLVRAWGLRKGGRWPAGSELAAARAASSRAALEIVGRRARRNHPDAGVEEGGFGKGLALRHAAASALAEGATCVALDFGGQIYRAGDCQAVEVAVAHPADRDRPVATIRLATGSLASSGNGERGMVVEGHRLGHLLDPRTGRPCPYDGSVTVLADDPLVADVLSTALFVLGPEAGRAWIDGPCWSALLVTPGPDGFRVVVPDGQLAEVRPTPDVTLTVLGEQRFPDTALGGCP